ncbi:hypothetical protein SRS16CHR_03597 [Variovorax sp. SRS16]|uniref:hypothetical protein n=1 Tax=Variovorax sp. SRS16 TaxID=282217 RepID=UPI001318778B|nr:hypothetical protein [Variovorax sp. SRS16]VTU25124.1 hypothetical protein SRS16CHR_03597 [Variovorax sp. SRS16]
MNSNHTQPLTSKIGGQEMLSPAGLLALVAGIAYGDPRSTPEGQATARRVLDSLLATATSHGFGKADILRTMLDKGERGRRIHALACEAASSMPTVAILKALQEGGFNVITA